MDLSSDPLTGCPAVQFKNAAMSVSPRDAFAASRKLGFPKTLAKTCADFSDLEIGADGCLSLLSDKAFPEFRICD